MRPAGLPCQRGGNGTGAWRGEGGGRPTEFEVEARGITAANLPPIDPSNGGGRLPLFQPREEAVNRLGG